MSARTLICAPMRLEARALRSAGQAGPVSREALRSAGLCGDTTVRRTGYGPKRSAHSAVRLLAADFDVLVVAGLAGGLGPQVHSGDVVVATEVRTGATTVPCTAAESLAAELERSGFPVLRGPIVTTRGVVHGKRRAQLAESGALAVDLESGVLAQAAGTRPVAVVRVVVDTARTPLLSPGTLPRGLAGLARLHAVGSCLQRWSRHIPPEIRTTREEV